MFDWVHYFWILLPIIYLIIWVKTYIKKVTKSDTQEPPAYFFRHFIFVSLLFGVACFLDYYIYGPQLSEYIEAEFGFDGFRILIYPLVLAVSAFIYARINPTELDIKRRAD